MSKKTTLTAGGFCPCGDADCDTNRAVAKNATVAKTTAERVDKLRKDRADLGLKRMELCAHPEDWPVIKALAEKLQRKRAKLAAPRAG